MSSTTSEAELVRACRELEQIASLNDAREFSNTEIRDVRQAAESVERELVARQMNCNMRRLEPLLSGLEHYSKPLEILCNGTPYLPWIWAPIKFILQVMLMQRMNRHRQELTASQLAKDHEDAFKLILDTYSCIADALGRFRILNEAFQKQEDFRAILGSFFANVAKFHQEAYKVVKRRSIVVPCQLDHREAN